MSNSLPRTVLWVAFGLACLSTPGAAQVGHNPESSPYHDLRSTHLAAIGVAYMDGTGGRAGVGPSTGPLGGLRYSIALGSSAEAMLGIYGGKLRRNLYDLSLPPERRLTGTALQSMLITDLGFLLRITGAKTWHGLMPYAGGSLGVAMAGSVSGDVSGFSFANRFEFGPRVGVRWYGPGSLSLWVEGWDPIWQLSYPATYFIATTPGGTPLLSSDVDPQKEWTHNPALLIGVGLTVRH